MMRGANRSKRAVVVVAALCFCSCGGSESATDSAGDTAEDGNTLPHEDVGPDTPVPEDTGQDTPAPEDVGQDTPPPEDIGEDLPAPEDVGTDTIVTPANKVIDHSCTDLSAIPADAIAQAKATLHIAYQHTSHGSQLITGMDALQGFPAFGGVYSWDDSGSDPNALDLDDNGIPGCDDLSQGDWVDENDDTPWVVATRELLDNPANSHVNVIVWSWCSINGHDAQRYVDNMEKLVAEYPAVVFVFMTGHAEGEGEDLTPDSVHYNNELIRDHCAAHQRWLFDFADIEAYDPDGVYYWDQSMHDNLDYDGGNWGVQWCAANPGSELEQLTTGNGVDGYDGCHECAHSDPPQEANLNCVLKGRAAWWLWARLAGWDG